MTPDQFINKWRDVELKERAASQSHFNDLCQLLGVDDPVTADPKGEWFTFEKGTKKNSGEKGWADVWREGCFGWEYKGLHANLDKALDQLRKYTVGLKNPPLLIVSDMHEIRVHTNWTNTVQETHTIPLSGLTDAKNTDLLRDAFTNPEKLKPTTTRNMLTEKAVKNFTNIAQRLREQGNDADKVAHFVVRLVFCMFADSVNLLPGNLFQKLVDKYHRKSKDFELHVKNLFSVMATGGPFGLDHIDWFNGGLFDNDEVLTLEWRDLDDLKRASALNWSEIDPAIMGTLFERGLDPSKRGQMGCHYTEFTKIQQIVEPVITDPLLQEWEQVRIQIENILNSIPEPTAQKLLSTKQKSQKTKMLKTAAKLHEDFIDRLKAFRVLDPACGSGNFLYVSLMEIKDIEKLVNFEAENLGLPRRFPQVGPEVVLGIEQSAFATELARVSVWIGEIQWMRINGFNVSKTPILKPLTTIENRDALLNPDGTPAQWPKADVVVGNPPFLGNKKMTAVLGKTYVASLRSAWKDVSSGTDFVAYWFFITFRKILTGELSRAGLIATSSIRGGANRRVLEPIVRTGRIFNCWSEEKWVADGANVEVSLICFDVGHTKTAKLNGNVVPEIFADLTSSSDGPDLTKAELLADNKNIGFQGFKFGGPFEIQPEQARQMLNEPLNPNGLGNAEVLYRWCNGKDITDRFEDRWCIDFGSQMSVKDAALFATPFKTLSTNWQNENDRRKSSGKAVLRAREKRTQQTWWHHQRSRPERRKKFSGLQRFIATPELSKHRIFVWLEKGMLTSGSVYSIARDDDTTFGILHSIFHEAWALRLGSSLEDRPRYTITTTFETFPFPENITPNISALDYASNKCAVKIAHAAKNLNALREKWLNPKEYVSRIPEIVSGYPDRITPVDGNAAKYLKDRTLTKLYNERPQWLKDAHDSLDLAVAEAYGWGDDWQAGNLTKEEILERLFQLNRTRAAKQKI